MSSKLYRVHTSWPGLVLDVPFEEYGFYEVIVALAKHKVIDKFMFLSAEREMILHGYKLVA